MAAKRFLQIWRDGRQGAAAPLEVPLMDGQQGNAQTLAYMKQIVCEDRRKNDLRRLVLGLVANVSGHDEKGEIEKIFEFARDRIVYRRDPVGVERIVDLWSTMFGLENSPRHVPEGDCGVKALFIATAAALLGYRPYFVIIRQIPDVPAFNHIYNMVEIDGEQIYLDATPADSVIGKQPKALERWLIPILD